MNVIRKLSIAIENPEQPAVQHAAQQYIQQVQQAGYKVLVCDGLDFINVLGADGVYLSATVAHQLQQRPAYIDWFGIAATTPGDLAHAQNLQADFASMPTNIYFDGWADWPFPIYARDEQQRVLNLSTHGDGVPCRSRPTNPLCTDA